MKNQREIARIVAGMRPNWFRRAIQRKLPRNDGRTIHEANFDSGVFAASEFVRRLTGDESLALAIHEMCFWKQRERGFEPAKETERP
jgi:hypothetical protein